jgi:hypothetical protein
MVHEDSRVGVFGDKARLRAFESLPIGVLVWRLEDPNDARSLRLVDCNAAAEREWGEFNGERVGKTIGTIAPGLLENGIAERYRQVVLRGKPETIGELRHEEANIPDRTFWIESFPLPARCVGVAIENITQRRRSEAGRTRDLEMLHRVTVGLNGSSSSLEAAQLCLDEVCENTHWPVGRLFLIDEKCATRFQPNSIWHFSDSARFTRFRQATEMYERDLKNKFVLEYRMRQGKKAGLTRSVGFSVLEGNWLRAVLEFSSEIDPDCDPASLNMMADVALQLGRVFERERAAFAFAELSERLRSQDRERLDEKRKLQACDGKYLSPLKNSLTTLRARKRRRSPTSTRALADSVRLVRRCLAEIRQISGTPVEIRRKA